MLAAQGYQESTLDQNKKSHVGAIGVMQIMPATGQSLKVGDISVTESNIHGGAKYMDQLMTQYFKDAKFDEQNRTLFAFASYNAGPGNIAKMRTEAEKRGLDPDKWFNNVEVVTAEKIGIETTTYVRNIFKYYVSYKLTQEARATAESSRSRSRRQRTEVSCGRRPSHEGQHDAARDEEDARATPSRRADCLSPRSRCRTRAARTRRTPGPSACESRSTRTRDRPAPMPANRLRKRLWRRSEHEPQRQRDRNGAVAALGGCHEDEHGDPQRRVRRLIAPRCDQRPPSHPKKIVAGMATSCSTSVSARISWTSMP